MLYINFNNQLHDDADGFALFLPTWPKDARIATQSEIDAILNPPKTLTEIVANQIEQVKNNRADILNQLDYFQLSALTNGDLGKAKAIELAKTELRDITELDVKSAKTEDEVAQLFDKKMADIADKLPDDVAMAFEQP